MPTIVYYDQAKTGDAEQMRVTADQWLEIKVKYGKPIAQQIREQLEAEGMTVKQILAKNCCRDPANDKNHCLNNRLTPIEATRRSIEYTIPLVRKRKPSDNQDGYQACFANDGLRCYKVAIAELGAFYLQTTEQWNLLREVIGDEELKELVQK